MKPSDIKLNPDNPRIIKDDKFKKLVKSLREFPEMADVRPVVINQQNIILGGNMRFRAMVEAGWKEIPVKKVDWPEEKQRQFIIKDNVSGGEWDWGALANNWDIDLIADWGVDMPKGFELETEIEEDEAPSVDTGEPRSSLGKVYQLGRHRVMCGDSTSLDHMNYLLDGKKADMVFTDPPYNVDYGNTMKDKLRHKAGSAPGRTILNDHFEDREHFYLFLRDAISAFAPFTQGGYTSLCPQVSLITYRGLSAILVDIGRRLSYG